jgi:hypothetical protein
LTPGFRYIEGEDHYKKCQPSLLSQLSYPINVSYEEGKPHQFIGTPSFFAREHPTPPSFRGRHTRNDSCYSNNGLLSLGDEESNVGSHNNTVTTKQHSPQLPQNTKQCSTSSSQFSAPNSVPSTTKLRRSTSLRQHQTTTASQPPLHTNNYHKTGNQTIHHGIINNNSNTTTPATNKALNCTHSQCNDTDSSFASKKVVPNKHESNNSNKSQNIKNNCIIRNTKSGVNNKNACFNNSSSHHAFKNRELCPNNNIVVTCSPSENVLNVSNRDPETVSNNFKANNPSLHSVTPLSLRCGKQRQLYRRSTSSPSPSRTGHETTSLSSHSSRTQKNEHNKSFIPAAYNNISNDITANKHNRNGNVTLSNITGAVNNSTILRNGGGSNEFRHGTHTRSSSASSFQKGSTIKGYQQDTITSIRRSRERRSQNSPSLSRIPSFSRTPSIRRSEKTSNSKKCTTNKSGPNMGNAVGSTASLASSSSGMENGQWSYPSSSQVIQAPPESTPLCLSR